MQKLLTLALFIIGCTLVPFFIVWANSGLRAAAQAWSQFAKYLGILLAVGAVVLGLMLAFPPVP
jgi:hypothetical protein